MIYAGILAGGNNLVSRNNLPIQFTNLGDKPLIVHTIEQFIVSSRFEKIIVVVPNNYMDFTEDLLENYFDLSNFCIISGGENKKSSISLISKYIEKNYGVNDQDTLLCHDAIRPFVTQKIINDNIDMSKKFKAINTVVPTIDTVIYSKNGKVIEDIPRTTYVYIEQTPQTFNLKSMIEIQEKANTDEFEREIDFARLYVSNGYEVNLLKGEFSNIKIVTEYDLEMAGSLIKERY